MYSIKQLRALWEKESLAYQTKEIGSGVQLFVKKLLQCPDIFALKEANLSTPEKDRKQEFLEESTKKNKRADIVIYVDSQVVMPMEIERYGNIQAGEEQLFMYQLVWDKKLGVLTDGYEWRFYVGKACLQTFTLDQIFDDTATFLAFWQDYTQPLRYYLNFFYVAGEQTSLFPEPEDLNVERYRQNFFTDITTLIESFEKKLNIKGYLESVGDKEANKNALELTYSYIIQFILYKTLADNDFEDFEQDFQQRMKRVERNLHQENFSDVLTATKYISDLVSKNIYKPFKSEQAFISEKLETLLGKATHELTDVTAWLDIFVFIKRYNFENIRNEIFGFIYENYLKQLYAENLGQYFTAPEVVDFMLQEMGYAGKTLAQNSTNNQISIIDPSCGSGTFLYSAVRNLMECLPADSENAITHLRELVSENIFGVDVAEFPLYLAEMSIIMRMLPLILKENYAHALDKKIKVFKTKDSVAEFLDTAVRNTQYDIQTQVSKNKGQVGLDFGSINLDYKSFIRDEDDLKAMKQSLENQVNPIIGRYRFDYVIGNPPYISYNDCAKQKTLFFEFMKEGKAKLNDVYGVNLHSTPDNPKGYRPNPNLYAFFVALGLGLLKEGGKLSYIIPQTLLTAGDLDVLRYHLAKYTTIEKIAIINSQLFTSRGLKQNHDVATSNLIIVVRKEKPTTNHLVEILYHPEIDKPLEVCMEDISKRKKNVRKITILQTELLQNTRNWNFLKLDKDAQTFYKTYLANTNDMSVYYQHNLAKNAFGTVFYFDGGYGVMEKEAFDVPAPNIKNYQIAKIDEKRLLLPINPRYVPNERTGTSALSIKLRQASQGYSLLDSSYKIVWSSRNPKQFHFTDLPVVWANNRLGGIGCEHEEELLFLLALLNSNVNRKVIEFFLKLEGEKDLLVQVNAIKEFIRVPFITSKQYNVYKTEIIDKIKESIALEQVKLSDLVDFQHVMTAKFADLSMEVRGNELVLMRGSFLSKTKIIGLPIKDKAHLVVNFAQQTFEKISLEALKNTIVLDEVRQNELKKAIDDLVFCLYFNVQLTDLQTNTFYLYLQDGKK